MKANINGVFYEISGLHNNGDEFIFKCMEFDIVIKKSNIQSFGYYYSKDIPEGYREVITWGA